MSENKRTKPTSVECHVPVEAYVSACTALLHAFDKPSPRGLDGDLHWSMVQKLGEVVDKFEEDNRRAKMLRERKHCK